ncbi:glycosyltransferase [Vibrio fluvialis]|nr:glycosyltransferase [Vibrio fluvialis]
MKKNIYLLFKTIYWSMPSSVRNLLNGFRYSVVRHLRTKLLTSSESNLSNFIDEEEFKKLLGEFTEIYIFELAVDWGIDLYQRPQHLATALGSIDNCLVIYKTQGDNVNGFKQVEKNVWLTNRLKFVDSLTNVKRIYFSTSIFNRQDHMIAMRDHGKIIYEYIDHVSEEISGGKKEIQHLIKIRDFAFEGGVDHVVATADALFNEAYDYLSSDKVTLIPNGVNVEHYQKNIENNINIGREINDFFDRYEKVVGYFGAIAPWLWYDLIKQVADNNPNVGFLMIGPDYGGCQSLLPNNNDNFLWIGPVRYQDLPMVAMKFDVCWIPFRLGEIAKTTSPLKLFEYFAMGKPVIVTSDMMECVKYQEVYHGADISEISQVLPIALQRVNDSDYCQKLKFLAAQNSWKNRALAYHSIHFI